MGMPAYHLVADGLRHVVEGEVATLLRDTGVEHHLQQQVAKLVLQIVQVATLDGVRHLVGFLDRIGRHGGEGLDLVPGATVNGIPQTGHDRDEAVDGSVRHGGTRALEER